MGKIMPKISIIIPVYNAQNYLHQCLQSALGQTIEELELLCVDDGSTDESVTIIKYYMKRDKRIRLFTQENSGAAVARNRALDQACGEYIAFLDADDYYLEKDALEKMYQFVRKHDLDVCGSICSKDMGGEIVEIEEYQKALNKDEDGCTVSYRDYQFDLHYISYIYSLKMLRKNRINFPGYRRFEDPVFLVRILTGVEKYGVCHCRLYCYRGHLDTEKQNEHTILGLLCGLRDNLQIADKEKLEKLKQATMDKINYLYCRAIVRLSVTKEARQVLGQIEKLAYPLPVIPCDILRKKTPEEISKEEKIVKERIWAAVRSSRKIYLYGAGDYGAAFLGGLKEEQLKKVICILVSEAAGNPKKLEGVPVKSIESLDKREIEEIKELGTVFITVSSKYQKEIGEMLERMEICNVQTVDDIFF